MPEFSRRQLFKLRLADITREMRKAVSSPGSKDAAENDEAPRFPRPPGAIRDEDAFMTTCERCHACAGACPHNAIVLYGPALGRLEGTPFIDPAMAPCHWCEDMPCINACPSGALHRDAAYPVPPMAKVVLDLDQCLNSQGILCDVCSYRCPQHIKAIRMVGRTPVLDSERCTGCGMCLFHCEAEPSAFHYGPVNE